MLRAFLHFTLLIAALFAAIAFLAGCATTPDSDIPWNVPQQWEGTPALPSGFMQQ